MLGYSCILLQDEYEGLIRPSSPINGVDEVLPYSFTGLLNHQLQLHSGETVCLSVSLFQGHVLSPGAVSSRCQFLHGSDQSYEYH